MTHFYTIDFPRMHILGTCYNACFKLSKFLNISDCFISLSNHSDDKVGNYVYLVIASKIEGRL